ncbi:hypothetical protein Fmac_024222 [Flemingia macrophylla]|uniref:Pre-mRNA-splicing factor SLU7 n=1 Tax=Flemingia macrophylla TaxID=520843 RepID=A0ABD1LNT7_9FABA
MPCMARFVMILRRIDMLISTCSCVAATFKSRENHRKKLELEEARKAGLAPAEVDEDGKEINPHIPQYMSSAPWYLNAEKPVSSPTVYYLHSFFYPLFVLMLKLSILSGFFCLFRV